MLLNADYILWCLLGETTVHKLGWLQKRHMNEDIVRPSPPKGNDHKRHTHRMWMGWGLDCQRSKGLEDQARSYHTDQIK